MADNAIASAYVQIIPTTEGISGKLNEELGGEAQKAGDDAGNKAGESLVKKMLKAIAVEGVAKKVGDFIKGAVDAGGALQQSIGGIETLFKNDADTMVAYANDAWKTVGISANDYMENVTSFSASLLQGLGGDTAKAAQIANMAMVDMGDNANKFGTDMQSIQNAYQGFAKQNYTMLDNLKLGYGGTKEEMARLLADAQKLTGVEYNMNNLSDIYEAIHAIQTEMGVAGTTAKEASSTLSGSFGAMKASWENLQGALATGEGVGDAMSAMGDTIVTYLRNLLPMIGSVVSRVPGLVITMVRSLGTQALLALRSFPWQEQIAGMVDGIKEFIGGEGLEEMIGIIMDVINGVADYIATAMPILMPAIVELLSYIVTTLIENMPRLIEAALTLLKGLADGLIAALPVLIAALPGIVQAIVDFIATSLPMILSSGMEILSSIANGIGAALPVLLSALPQIVQSIVNFIVWNLPQIVTQGVQIIVSLVNGLIQALPQIVAAIPQIIKSVVNTLKQNGPTLKAAGRNMLQTIKDGILSILGSLGQVGLNIVKGLWSGISGAAGWLAQQVRGFASNIVKNMVSALKIGSPSKVLADEVGHWIPAGIAEGMKENSDVIRKEMNTIREDLTNGSGLKLAAAVTASSRTVSEEIVRGQDLPGSGNEQARIYKLQIPLIIDGKEIARATATFTQDELNRLSRNNNRKLGIVQ